MKTLNWILYTLGMQEWKCMLQLHTKAKIRKYSVQKVAHKQQEHENVAQEQHTRATRTLLHVHRGIVTSIWIRCTNFVKRNEVAVDMTATDQGMPSQLLVASALLNISGEGGQLSSPPSRAFLAIRVSWAQRIAAWTAQPWCPGCFLSFNKSCAHASSCKPSYEYFLVLVLSGIQGWAINQRGQLNNVVGWNDKPVIFLILSSKL